MKDILILKTNIATEADEELLANYLDNNNAILNWNVDREDIDNVLRVESSALAVSELISILSKSGFEAEELEG